MSGTNTAGQVPTRYDVVIDGYGYVTARAVDPNMPFRVQQQMLSYSPTFVERQNVSNSYGDNAQDFFLTIRQRDWSLGEQQKFFRAGSDGRYWMGSNVDVTVPGQVRLASTVTSISFAGAVRAGDADQATQGIYAVSATNLYLVAADGTITDKGAHGLGATPSRFGFVSDGGNNHYISTTTAGTVGVRQWSGAAFSTFSASGADTLAFLNNSLYGFRVSSSDLVRWDTGGTLTSLFPWKDTAGNTGATAGYPAGALLEPYGGKLLIAMLGGGAPTGNRGLWIYDGSGVAKIAEFPPNFVLFDMVVLYGVVFISGNFHKPASTSNVYARPAVLFYDGSELGKLWSANDYGTSSISDGVAGPGPGLGVNDGRLIFSDDTTSLILAYNPVTGGVSTIGSYSAGGTNPNVLTGAAFVLMTRNQTTAYYWPHISSYPSSGYVISSLIDFDSSLAKVFRGVTVEFDAASDGNGGSVDLAYQLNGLAGSWTSLATGVTSGTEAAFPASTTGHSVAIKATVNKGTSTSGPTLKSLSVRGVPVMPPYRLNEFIFDLGGDASGQNPVMLRDGSLHPLTGEQQRVNLVAALTSTTPITITDRTGTYTGILEPGNCEFDLTRPGQWYARIRAREV